MGISVGLLVNFTRDKAEIKRLVFDLPEGQREKYPAKSAGYCLCRSNERSERAAIKNNHIKNCFYQLHRFTPTKLEKNLTF
jgi:hypothetical protein